MWQEVVHHKSAQGLLEVKIKKTPLYSYALIQDLLMWAIMSPHAAAAEARNAAADADDPVGADMGDGGKKRQSMSVKLSMS